jgi:pseudouridine kinase
MTDQKSVLCVGALHFDRIAECEKPLQMATSNPVRSHRSPGGVAHNIARNLKLLSRSVGMCSMIGDDGDDLKRYLSQQDISHDLVNKSLQLPTANYTAVLDPGGELAFGLADMAIYDQMDVPYLEENLEDMLTWPVWLIDANLPADSLSFLTRHKDNQLVCAAPVSTRKASRWDLPMVGSDIWIGNAMEATELTGIPSGSSEQALRAATALFERGPDVVVVTLGPDGAVLKSEECAGHWSPPPTTVINVNGAGDSFYAGFLDAILCGNSPEDAMDQGIAVSSLTTESSDPVRMDICPELVTTRQSQVPHFRAL